MTDEKIKELLDASFDSEIDDDAFRFGVAYTTDREGKPDGYKNVARGFYAGFRAAERLAKIDVLEEVLSRYTGEYIDSFAIETMLAELKSGQ